MLSPVSSLTTLSGHSFPIYVVDGEYKTLGKPVVECIWTGRAHYEKLRHVTRRVVKGSAKVRPMLGALGIQDLLNRYDNGNLSTDTAWYWLRTVLLPLLQRQPPADDVQMSAPVAEEAKSEASAANPSAMNPFPQAAAVVAARNKAEQDRLERLRKLYDEEHDSILRGTHPLVQWILGQIRTWQTQTTGTATSTVASTESTQLDTYGVEHGAKLRDCIIKLLRESGWDARITQKTYIVVLRAI